MTLVDATTLTVVTPAHAAGVVDVTVTNENGSNTLVGGFTFNDPPVLTAVTPSNGTPFGGDSIQLTGSGFTTTTTVTFDGISAAVTFVDVNTLTATTPAHAPGAVNVTVSNVNGTDTLVGGFTYDSPPTVSAVTPTSGSTLGV